MKRRQFLGMAAGASVAGVAGWHTAEKLKVEPTFSTAPPALVNEPVMFKHDGTDLQIEPGQFHIMQPMEPPKLTFYHDSLNRAEVYFDEGTQELVLENKVTGRTIRV